MIQVPDYTPGPQVYVPAGAAYPVRAPYYPWAATAEQIRRTTGIVNADDTLPATYTYINANGVSTTVIREPR